jgi:hypothetical protein
MIQIRALKNYIWQKNQQIRMKSDEFSVKYNIYFFIQRYRLQTSD